MHSGHLTLEQSREMRTLDIKRLGDSAEIFQDKFVTFPVYYFFKFTLTEHEMNIFVSTGVQVIVLRHLRQFPSFVRSSVRPFVHSFIIEEYMHLLID